MKNTELIKILNWIKINHLEEYNKYSSFGEMGEFDVNLFDENWIDYNIKINDIMIHICYNIPNFNKELGFVFSDDATEPISLFLLHGFTTSIEVHNFDEFIKEFGFLTLLIKERII